MWASHLPPPMSVISCFSLRPRIAWCPCPLCDSSPTCLFCSWTGDPNHLASFVCRLSYMPIYWACCAGLLTMWLARYSKSIISWCGSRAHQRAWWARLHHCLCWSVDVVVNGWFQDVVWNVAYQDVGHAWKRYIGGGKATDWAGQMGHEAVEDHGDGSRWWVDSENGCLSWLAWQWYKKR